MATGRVKIFDEDRRFGFITPDEGTRDLYVHSDHVAEGAPLRPGDAVEFEVEDGDGKPAARQVKVTGRAPEGTPVGKVSGPPPTWDELEVIAREERSRRRGRRR